MPASFLYADPSAWAFAFVCLHQCFYLLFICWLMFSDLHRFSELIRILTVRAIWLSAPMSVTCLFPFILYASLFRSVTLQPSRVFVCFYLCFLPHLSVLIHYLSLFSHRLWLPQAAVFGVGACVVACAHCLSSLRRPTEAQRRALSSGPAPAAFGTFQNAFGPIRAGCQGGLLLKSTNKLLMRFGYSRA